MLNPNIYKGRIDILYEDNDIIVLNKPWDISTHDAPDWNGPTLVDTLKYYNYKLYRGETSLKDGVVHRLDVGTSGVMVFVKTERAYNSLKSQFKDHSTKKIYHALVEGTTLPNGMISLPIGKVDDERHIYDVTMDGKQSLTYYKTLKNITGLPNKPASLVEINLKTGRTHQIRVHFSHIGHPLIGDTKYGSNKSFEPLIDRQWLHAKYLEFTHPSSGERIYFNADYPKDLKQTLVFLDSRFSGISQDSN